jgi:hypothetical protein
VRRVACQALSVLAIIVAVFIAAVMCARGVMVALGGLPLGDGEGVEFMAGGLMIAAFGLAEVLLGEIADAR